MEHCIRCEQLNDTLFETNHEMREVYKLLLKMMEFNYWLWEESTETPLAYLWLSSKTRESGVIAEIQDKIAELLPNCDTSTQSKIKGENEDE